ncbi:hypothetical protein [Parafrankia sp. FMc2]|uniref:hypothetical protein n=1 Tax=Parafrankia sp. FMc2 TaxID=3233196 RepID=UPI0034D6D9E0
MRHIDSALVQERAAISAISRVAEHGLSEATYLTQMRNQLEAAVPDASEALALIAGTANMAIARMVARFGSEMS